MSQTLYDEVWQRFTQNNRIVRAPRGEGVGLVLLVWLQERGIVERIATLQRALARELPIDPIPQHALHITLRDLGTLTDQLPATPAAMQVHPDRLPALLEHLDAVLKGWPSFRVVLKRVNSFSVCPLLEVHDGGVVGCLRAAIEPGLRDLGFDDHDYGPGGFIPHLTLGYYNEDGEGAPAREVLERMRQQEVGVIQVQRLALIRAPWSAGLYHLETVQEFELDVEHR